MVDAGRRRFRCRNSAHGDRQDSKNGVARPVQRLRAAGRGRVTIRGPERKWRPRVPYPALQYCRSAMRIMHNYSIFELGWLFPFSLPNDCNYNVLIKMTGDHFVAAKISFSVSVVDF